MAAAQAVLDVMRDEDTMSNAKKVGAIFKDAVASLMPAHPCIGDVRGAGLYIGCEIVKPGTKDPDQQAALDILETLRDNHILTSVCAVTAISSSCARRWCSANPMWIGSWMDS